MNKNLLTATRAIFKTHPVKFAYLFGSQLTGKTNKDSDYDFAVYLDVKLNLKKRFATRINLICELEKKLKHKVDLVVLNDVQSVEFKFVIEKEGKLIYCIDRGLYLDQALKYINEYIDFKPFIDEYNKAYVARIK